MVSERQALTAWQDTLEEAVGVDEAATRGDLRDLNDDIDRRIDDKLESLANRLLAAWRRDLLLIAVPQFVALSAILAGVGG